MLRGLTLSLIPVFALCHLARSQTAWVTATPASQPMARSHAALATDLARGEVLLFGGWSPAGAVLGDTWAWSDAGFFRRWPAHNPPQRRNHALAYDARRQRVVLFGGQSSNAYFGDTWEWDGTDWTLRSTGGPSARTGAAMAYDETRNRIVLFGGLLSNVHSAETWEWDGTTWTLRVPAVNPPARALHAMAYDVSSQRIVLFGGQGAQVQMDDTWLWDGTQWLAGPIGPPARWGHGMTFDSQQNKVLLVGGRNQAGPMPDVVWEWGGANWVARPHNAGHFGDGCALAFDPLMQRPMLFGSKGANVGGYGHWDAALQEWIFYDASAGPRQLSELGLAAAEARQRVVAVGLRIDGISTSAYRRVTTEWDGASWHLRNYGTTPKAVALATDASGEPLLFGGVTNQETWSWNGTTWQELSVPLAPPARTETTMVLDPLRGRVVLFGGRAVGGALLQDTWEWDGVQWAPRPSAVRPSARTGHAMGYDENRAAVVLFGGGGTGPNPLGDSWQWDGTDWTSLAFGSQPPARIRGSMAFDRARQRLVLAGGRVTVPYPLQGYDLQDSWDLGPAGWSQGSSLPAPSASGLSAWDATRQAVLYLHPGADPWLGGNVAAPSQAPLGGGCVGKAGVPALSCTAPALGADAAVTLTNVLPNATCVTAWSFTHTPVGIGHGCILHVHGWMRTRVVVADASGRSETPLSIPLDPVLRGTNLYVQGATLDAVGRVVLSDALALTVGD